MTPPGTTGTKTTGAPLTLDEEGLEHLEQRLQNSSLDLDPDDPEKGLAKLVLTVLELLRELLERQAIRRMDGGSLSDDEVERLGEAFYRLQQKLDELKEFFELSDDDLNIDLGPLGKLL